MPTASGGRDRADARDTPRTILAKRGAVPPVRPQGDAMLTGSYVPRVVALRELGAYTLNTYTLVAETT